MEKNEKSTKDTQHPPIKIKRLVTNSRGCERWKTAEKLWVSSSVLIVRQKHVAQPKFATTLMKWPNGWPCLQSSSGSYVYRSFKCTHFHMNSLFSSPSGVLCSLSTHGFNLVVLRRAMSALVMGGWRWWLKGRARLSTIRQSMQNSTETKKVNRLIWRIQGSWLRRWSRCDQRKRISGRKRRETNVATSYLRHQFWSSYLYVGIRRKTTRYSLVKTVEK